MSRLILRHMVRKSGRQFSSEAYKREKHSRAKKVKRDPDEATAFDKILAAIGSVLGVAMLAMLVYIVGSLSGAFQRTPTSISANKKRQLQLMKMIQSSQHMRTNRGRMQTAEQKCQSFLV